MYGHYVDVGPVTLYHDLGLFNNIDWRFSLSTRYPLTYYGTVTGNGASSQSDLIQTGYQLPLPLFHRRIEIDGIE